MFDCELTKCTANVPSGWICSLQLMVLTPAYNASGHSAGTLANVNKIRLAKRDHKHALYAKLKSPEKLTPANFSAGLTAPKARNSSTNKSSKPLGEVAN